MAFSFESTIDHRGSNVQHLESAVSVWGTGNARREFLHVDDLADACLVIMEKWEDPEHINVGAGEDLTIRELVELVREIVFPEAHVVFDSFQARRDTPETPGYQPP